MRKKGKKDKKCRETAGLKKVNKKMSEMEKIEKKIDAHRNKISFLIINNHYLGGP